MSKQNSFSRVLHIPGDTMSSGTKKTKYLLSPSFSFFLQPVGDHNSRTQFWVFRGEFSSLSHEVALKVKLPQWMSLEKRKSLETTPKPPWDYWLYVADSQFLLMGLLLVFGPGWKFLWLLKWRPSNLINLLSPQSIWRLCYRCTSILDFNILMHLPQQNAHKWRI